MSTAQDNSALPEGGISSSRQKMRGGLGRTLLTAFLLLAIGPLSLVSLYAINRSSQENQRQQEELMLLQVESIRDQLIIASQESKLSLMASHDDDQNDSHWWRFTTDGDVVEFSSAPPLPSWLDAERSLTEWQVGGVPLALWVSAPLPSTLAHNETIWQAQLLPLDSLLTRAMSPSLRGTRVYIQEDERVMPLLSETPPLPAALIAELNQTQTDGIIYPSTEQQRLATLFSRTELQDGLSLLLMLPSEALQRAENGTTGNLAAALMAAALLAALGTTIAAALMTRRITRPLYELTQAAVKIAQGDLKQRVQIRQDNELGILALAFNTMTDQLHETLETLEERVAERTEALRQANAEIAEHARRLELGAEIGTKLSRYDDLAQLLSEGCALIAKSFDYQDVSILSLTYRTTMPPPPDATQSQLAERMLQHGQALFAEDKRSLALPLRVADNVLGALILTHKRHFQEHEQQHLQILADAFAVAIERLRNGTSGDR